ncbi:MAG: 4-hydroxy-3-methylbut-2-enyl diphosphate reductase [Nanoarchaeota archaeon]|nr:4-hydroxy-3-methylbut-2-enyl diphosphate reductase [Nanoarchaeota archaeon]
MKVYLAEHAGFCFGVKRAIDLATKLIGQENVYTLGPLIHNPQVIEGMEKNGIRCIEDLTEIPEGKIIIRAHGVPLQTIQKAKQKGLEVIDATCPYVKKVHNITKKLQNQGYQVIIFGEKEHPEVIGVKGNSENAIVIENLEEAQKLSGYKSIGVVSQTTQSKEKFETVIEELKNHTKDLTVYNTICDATEKRQQSAVELSKKVDLMIVLGGLNSGNTRRLAELCNKETTTIHVEKFSDIEKKILENKENVGITAGASTPDYMIKELIQGLEVYTG